MLVTMYKFDLGNFTEFGWKHEPANEHSQQFTRKGGHFFIGLVHMSVPVDDTEGQEFSSFHNLATSFFHTNKL